MNASWKHVSWRNFRPALFAALMGCDASFRCDPSPSWSSPPRVQTDASMPGCTEALCEVSTAAAGARHTCAVVGSESDVLCWGANEVGQSNWRAPSQFVAPMRTGQRVYPGPSVAYRTLAVGELRTCVAAGDRILCWGGPAPSPELLSLHYDGYLEVGLEDVCVRSPSGTDCLNTSPGFGDPILLGGASRVVWLGGQWRIQGVVPGVGLLRNQPTFLMTVEGSSGVEPLGLRNAVAVGALHVCTFDSTRGTRCVGRGDRGQLGMRYMPTDAPEGTRTPTLIGTPESVCAGGHLNARWTPEGIAVDGPHGGHTCRIFSAGPDALGVYCMGANDRGQLGIGLSVDTNVFTRVVGLPHERVRQIYCGGEHTCARTDTELFCWGDNRFGQLAVDPGTLAFSARPVRIDLASAFRNSE